MKKLNRKILAKKTLANLLVDISKGLIPSGTIYSWCDRDGVDRGGELRYIASKKALLYRYDSNGDNFRGDAMIEHTLGILKSKVILKKPAAFLIGDYVKVKKLLIEHNPVVGMGDEFVITEISNDSRVVTCSHNSFDPREIELLNARPTIAELNNIPNVEENFLN